MLPWTRPLILSFLISSRAKQRSYCEMIVKFHDNYENHLVQGYLIAAVSVMDAILLIANIVFSLSWAFTFSSASIYHLTLRKLPVGIVLARAHQHPLFFGDENIHHELVKVKAPGSPAAVSCGRGCIRMLRWRCQQSASCPLSSPHCPVLASLSGKALPVYWQDGLQQL